MTAVRRHTNIRNAIRGATVAVAASVLFTCTAGTASAAGDDLASVSVQPSSLVAGAHSDVDVDFDIATTDFPASPDFGFPFDSLTYPNGELRDLDLDLPAGLLGDPLATPTCTTAQLRDSSRGLCDPAAQVGFIETRIQQQSYEDGSNGVELSRDPVYNMQRGPGQPARLAIPVQNGVAILQVHLRTREDGDQGITAEIRDVPNSLNIVGANLVLWGTPSAAANDDQRLCPDPATSQDAKPCDPPATRSLKPFMVNGTRCDVARPAEMRITTWGAPDVVSRRQSTPIGFTGCGEVPFAPTFGATPDTRAAGQPAGYAFDLNVPQTSGADERATPHVRDVTVALPEGTAISPSAANGLAACSDEQLGRGTRNAAACPDASKIGSVSVASPIVESPLTGSVYLGTQKSNDPASGDMYRVFVVAEGHGVRIKLLGRISANPQTGQLTASFAGNPELPFSALNLRFDGGPRAPLVNPTTCGTKTTRATITSWAGQTVTSDSSFVIDQGCPTGAFNPSFTAGTLSPLAGAYSPFTTTITRGDGEQELSQVALDLPSGLLGDLGSVPVCAEAQAAAGTCGAASRVGSTTVQAGSGPKPFSLPGTVSLGGPYKGAPFSLSIAVPAKAGPLDLGLVVVRAPLNVDAANGKVSTPVDPLPTVVGGVPLKLRSVSVTLDRQNFIFNATNCNAQAIGSTLTGTGGGVAKPSVRYQADGCANLKLAPSLKLDLSGSKDLKKGGNPKLTADLGQTFGQASMKSVQVTLPLLSSLKPENAKALCTPAQDAAGACPAASIVGRASARTRALHEPIGGPIYFVEGTRTTASGKVVKTLPKLLLKLSGDGVSLDLRADTSVDSTGRLITTFPKVPDVPIEDFHLEIDGGENGILTAVDDPCTADRRAKVRFDGHNGARNERGLTVMTPQCGLRAAMNTSPTRVKFSYANVGAGRLTVSGRGLRTTRRTIRSATSATVVAPLTASVRRRVASGRTVRLRLTASFLPKGAKKTQKVTKTVAVRGVKKRR
ncbi:hypothetical protein [Patulibacter sp.]|uniref:hypothetical protein n=1 Tax=Patulibacter sp. TaxID=1912859 RepID=UPI002716FC29|nr:hypothetical protein [Patulibacter sp.]MDO9407400.1 hypothetical protein [Patulibacter sp.]